MTQRQFGGADTIVKLKTLKDYLTFYTRALSNKFRLTYFDAFAGTGEIPLGDRLPLFDGMIEMADVVEGSAVRALSISPPFDRYVFVDSNKRNVAGLGELRSEFPALASRIEVIHDDANGAVRAFCSNGFRSDCDRAVIFLDPFGNQVHWATIEAISKRVGIDLWYLFPSGLGVVRQLSSNGQVQKDARGSLDLMIGTTEWYDSMVVSQDQHDLFDADREQRQKIATADDVTKYMIGRMKTVFADRVLDQWLPLGRKGGHWYSLIFAWSNPSAAATELARRVAKDIMRRK